MKTAVICIICLAGTFFGCHYLNGNNGIEGSGVLKEESREIGAFSKLEIAGAFHVEAEPGDEPGMHLFAEDNLLPLIQTRIEGDTLVLNTKESVSPTLEMKVKLTFIDMESLSSNGANFVLIEGARSERFHSRLRGAGLTRITGEVEDLKVEVEGAGIVELKELKAKTVKVDLKGASVVTVHATDSLDAQIAGVGSIGYRGNPGTLNQNVKGIGSIYALKE